MKAEIPESKMPTGYPSKVHMGEPGGAAAEETLVGAFPKADGSSSLPCCPSLSCLLLLD